MVLDSMSVSDGKINAVPKKHQSFYLKRDLESLQQAQIDSAEHYAELPALAAEKIEAVRQMQSSLDVVTGDLSATNFELAVLSNQISQNRAAIKNAERQLKSFELNEVSE